jgi:hypothetical protein
LLLGLASLFELPVGQGSGLAKRKRKNQDYRLDQNDDDYPQGDHSNFLSFSKSPIMPVTFSNITTKFTDLPNKNARRIVDISQTKLLSFT